MRTFPTAGFLAAAIIALATAVSAATIRVSQESSAGVGDFDANVLGFVDTFDTAMTVAAFYHYGVPNGSSYNGELNGGPVPISSATQSFFVSGSDGVALVTVHDNPNDGTGGNTSMTHVLAGGAGGAAAFLLSDDPGESSTVSDVGPDRRFDTTRNWIACCTDGHAIGDLGSSFTMFGAFDTFPTGIIAWNAVSGDFSAVALVIQPSRRVRFDTVTPVIPVPAGGYLILSAFGLFGLLRHRRTR